MGTPAFFSQFTRRDFLKGFGLGIFSSFVPFEALNYLIENQTKLGRVARNNISYFDSPSYAANKKGLLFQDMLLKITEEITAESVNGRETLWFRFGDNAFVPSNYVQPVRRENQISNEPIPEEGRLGEVSVPFIDSYKKIRSNWWAYRFYYETTFWVWERIVDEWGVAWYRILDDRYNSSYYVRAYAVRLVPYEELKPISADLHPEDKYLLVNLKKQKVDAYEKERLVFSAPISSGTINEEGTYYTPAGEFQTNQKRPCRHMVSLAGSGYSGYDLPGVPWVSYFTSNGIAFHGAYWHNNFGVPMSHGCINMSSQAAKWIYLWTTPEVPNNKYHHVEHNGTRVIII